MGVEDQTDRWFPIAELVRESGPPERTTSTREWLTGKVLRSVCAIFFIESHCLVNLLQQLSDGWYFSWIEFLNPRGIHGHTDTPRLWVNAKGSLEQMVSMFRDFRVDSRPGVLKNDVFHRGPEKFLRERTKSPSDLLAAKGELTPGTVALPWILTWFLMSSHFSSDDLSGSAVHFFRKGSIWAFVGSKARSSSAPASPAKQSWSWRMSGGNISCNKFMNSLESLSETLKANGWPMLTEYPGAKASSPA